MFKKLLIYAILIFITLSFIACGSVPDSSLENNNQSTKYGIKDDIMDKGPVKGGTLHIFSTQPDTLNPILTNNAYVRDFLNLMFDSLIIIDSNQKPLPNLAKAWEFSEGGYVLTLMLKEDILWHDNTHLSAEDVEFTILALQRSELGSVYRKNVENIETCEIIDSNKIKLKLKNVNYFTINYLNFPIIPKHYYEKENISEKDSEINMKPVGSGPYKFVSYKDNEVRMTTNTKWWMAVVASNGLTIPYISEVCVKIYANAKDAVNAFNRNETDIVSIDSGQYSAYSGRTDIIMKKYISRNYEFLAFNLSKPITGDKAVRQAISYALDKLRLINDVIPGEAIAADFPISPEAWLSESKNTVVIPDKTNAKEVLRRGYWKEINGGFYKYIDEIYTPLTLELLCNEDNDTRIRIAQKISEQLKEIGIIINIKKVTWEEAIKLIDQKKFDIVLIGSGTNSIPDLSFLYSTSLVNTKIQGTVAKNIAGYSNPKVDEYLSNTFKSFIDEDVKYYIRSAKEIINDEVPYLGLYFKYETTLFSKRIRGDINPYSWDRFKGISRWYIPQN